MPGSSKAVHPSGVEIKFFEDSHLYKSIIDGHLLTYTSGTGVVGKYFPPFDPSGEITQKCAKREGISVDELKARWKAKGVASCKFGTRVHECCEDIILKRATLRNTPETDKEKIVFKHAVNIATKFRNQLDILGVEKIVFSPELAIAGTIDLLARSRKDGSIIIIDHKTNEEITSENKWGNFGLGPLQDVPDNQFYHYAIQTNLYQYLLWREGYVKRDSKFKRILNHLTVDGAKMIEIPDMQPEVREMILDFELKRFKNSNMLKAI